VNNVVLNPLAEADLIVGREWCDEHRNGSGIDFLVCAIKLFERLRQEPYRYGEEFEDLRIAPIRPFPYAVAYRVDGTQVTIVAVYHTRSDPRKWQSRA